MTTHWLNGVTSIATHKLSLTTQISHDGDRDLGWRKVQYMTIIYRIVPNNVTSGWLLQLQSYTTEHVFCKCCCMHNVVATMPSPSRWHDVHEWPWWRHQMETFSALLANPPVTGGFPSQRPVTRSFDDFADLHLNKQLSKQSRRRWIETPSRLLWR